jgi:hypothetical protein
MLNREGTKNWFIHMLSSISCSSHLKNLYRRAKHGTILERTKYLGVPYQNKKKIPGGCRSLRLEKNRAQAGVVGEQAVERD